MSTHLASHGRSFSIANPLVWRSWLRRSVMQRWLLQNRFPIPMTLTFFSFPGLWNRYCHWHLVSGWDDKTMYSILRILFQTCPVWWMMSGFVRVVYSVHNDSLVLAWNLTRESYEKDCKWSVQFIHPWSSGLLICILQDFFAGTGVIMKWPHEEWTTIQHMVAPIEVARWHCKPSCIEKCLVKPHYNTVYHHDVCSIIKQ